MACLPSYWLISSVVLISMILQLVLAFGGSLRHRSSTSILQVSLWLSYISADAVAFYALGTMARASIISGLFGIWAPLLLLHLGGPDTVTAYSTADNELWGRHLLSMVYQVSVAIYVIYLSELKSDLFVAAILLLFVGGFKCAERTVALRWASFSQILKSAQQHTTPEQLLPRSYVASSEQRTGNREAAEPLTREARTTNNYILCLAHAMFKMNMRRYVGLDTFETGLGMRGDTPNFFFHEKLCHLSTRHIFLVIEIELKFMYDTLFCKSRGTAFSKWGTIMRIVNIFLLGVGGGLIYRALSHGHEKEVVGETQRMVCYIVISVALMVELLQLCRIIASDWTLVSLICSHVQDPNKLFTTRALWLLGKLRRSLGRLYWKKSVQQYSIIDTCSQISPSVWEWGESLNMTDFITDWYTKSDRIRDELSQFILDELRGKISQPPSREDFRQRISIIANILDGALRWISRTDPNLILYWHIATSIYKECNPTSPMENGSTVERNKQLSLTLSNYCAYLLVSCPEFLTLHPDIAKIQWIDAHSELVTFLSNCVDIRELIEYEAETNLGKSARLASQLKNGRGEAEVWTILSGFWAGVLIYYASLNKAAVHAEHLTVGGEFLTQLWALVGHMGCGD